MPKKRIQVFINPNLKNLFNFLFPQQQKKLIKDNYCIMPIAAIVMVGWVITVAPFPT